MSFNIANRLNNPSATTTSILNDLSDNYYTKTASDDNFYTKAQTDAAIATSIRCKRLHQGRNRYRDTQLEEQASGDKKPITMQTIPFL